MKVLKYLLFIFAMNMINYTYAQSTDQRDLGKLSAFKKTLQNKAAEQKLIQSRTTGFTLNVELPDRATLPLAVKFYEEKKEALTLVGKIKDSENSNFFIKIENDELRGNIVLKDENRAFEYSVTPKGKVLITEKRIDHVMCVNYPEQSGIKEKVKENIASLEVAEAVNNLQSLPGAYGVVLLDFDGYYLPSGTGWNDGNPLNASPSGMSDADIQEAWELISEDYRPFNINITTSQAVFDSYPQNRRMRCIFTPTKDVAPTAGGVAYVNSFGYQDWPCWVFILSGKAGGEAASHEIGHTLGLGHDGRSNPAEEYFAGHGDWAPIMGVGYYRNITQWSKGEYAYANNTQDDLTIMAGYVGFRDDDHGNNFTSATTITSNTSGNIVEQKGVIERTSDQDMFTFNCGTGNVYLDVNTVSRHGDLNILVRLYESSGVLIGNFDGSGLNSRIEAYLDAGKYYLSVQGNGSGNPSTNGYSNYSSLGTFSITGTIPPAASNEGVVTLYQHCPYDGYAIGLSEGSYTLAQLQAMGMSDNAISSIKVQSGYKAILYDGDNFTGTSLEKTADEDCLTADGFNDTLTSVVVSRNITNEEVVTLYQHCPYDGYSIGLSEGSYTLAQLQAMGMTNDDISSVKVQSGYSVTFYDNDNFTGDSLVKTSDDDCIADDGFNDRTTSIIVSRTTTGGSTVIEAENYFNMSGVQVEACNEGGENVGYIDAGDWMAYASINFPVSGNYLIEYRVASESGGGVLSADLNAGTTVLGQLDVPNTGGWQNWTTISHTVYVTAGTHAFGVFAQTGGWNLNWIKITAQAGTLATSLSTSTMEDVDSVLVEEAVIYPNPFTSYVQFKFIGKEAKAAIYDMAGNIVMKLNRIAPQQPVDLSNLNKGLYFINIYKEGKTITRRLIKK
ncbi:carbohydrate-binding protein [Abyssalbus ytuae]|uniref:Carbohydrate-binding protein n=1 Tax=Abyssalbus ytuae TaxID=2926907 RepID=A0A9E7A251_9FLAO|nr:carbohydrate-binding protein [Abyssalbus ytuae]UOB18381.1 carbohydrate-binding protein [Abyssalbus ytuae]